MVTRPTLLQRAQDLAERGQRVRALARPLLKAGAVADAVDLWMQELFAMSLAESKRADDAEDRCMRLEERIAALEEAATKP